MAEPARTQIYTVAKNGSHGKRHVVENGDYAPISLRIDAAQTNAQVRYALNTLLTYFQKAGT